MKKEEWMQLHTLLVQVKRYCEEQGLDCDFSKYNALGITPSHVYRRKGEHKQAVFVLAAEFAAMAKRSDIRSKKHSEKNCVHTLAV
jgi:hypothetical protein